MGKYHSNFVLSDATFESIAKDETNDQVERWCVKLERAEASPLAYVTQRELVRDLVTQAKRDPAQREVALGVVRVMGSRIADAVRQVWTENGKPIKETSEEEKMAKYQLKEGEYIGIVDGYIDVHLKLVPGVASSTGKSLIVAGTGGFTDIDGSDTMVLVTACVPMKRLARA